MKKLNLLGTVAAGLLFTAGAAAAQEMQSQQQNRVPERAPAAQQNAPSEKMAPSMQHQQSSEEPKGRTREQSETTGQMRDGTPSGGRDERGDMNKPPESRKGANQKEQRGMQERRGAQEERRGPSGTAERERGTSGATVQEREQRSTTGERERDRTIGQGAAGPTRLSTEQRTRITTIFRQHREARPVRLNIPVRVGARVPANVRFYPLPTEVVEIYPEWRGFDYIQIAGRILVLDPATHEIVAILDV